jgi:hypothetical protein
MPLKIILNGEEKWIYPTENWKEITLNSDAHNFKIDENFYVFTIKVS